MKLLSMKYDGMEFSHFIPLLSDNIYFNFFLIFWNNFTNLSFLTTILISS